MGQVTAGGWFDIEAVPETRACGQQVHYTERILTTKGGLTVRATGPRLCEGVVGTFHRMYTVIRAAGGLRHIRGHGVITLTVLSSGATETWTPPGPSL
jgi:hypothetical protein